MGLVWLLSIYLSTVLYYWSGFQTIMRDRQSPTRHTQQNESSWRNNPACRRSRSSAEISLGPAWHKTKTKIWLGMRLGRLTFPYLHTLTWLMSASARLCFRGGGAGYLPSLIQHHHSASTTTTPATATAAASDYIYYTYVVCIMYNTVSQTKYILYIHSLLSSFFSTHF